MDDDQRAPEVEPLDSALADLVARHVLDEEQARQVRTAFVDRASGVPPAPASPLAGPSMRRDRLVEGAAYLGAVLVSASLLVIVGQRWADLSEPARIGLLVLLAAVAAVAGWAVARTVPGGRLALRQKQFAARRRVVSVLLTGASGLLAAAVGVALGDRTATAFVVAVVALALLVGVEWAAPSALVELAMFLATVSAAASFVDLVLPDRAPSSTPELDEEPRAVPEDYVIPAVMVLVGVLWALVVADRLTVPLLGVGLGLVTAFWSALPAAGDPRLRGWGLTMLALLAVGGLLVYLRDRRWPWLALVVVSATAFVALLVRQAAGPAVAFLVAGLLLLAGAGIGARAGRRRAPLT